MEQSIGTKIKIGLARSGMKQKEVAKKMGISNKVISSWCTGNSTPPGDKMLALIRVLEIEDLFFDSPAKAGGE